MIASGNLHEKTSAAPGAEIFDTLFESGEVGITRIVSNAHVSPEGFWYDQDEDEWVAVIAGKATLEFDSGGLREMKTGDWIVIPARTRHRIAGTSAGTTWLAVHARTTS